MSMFSESDGAAFSRRDFLERLGGMGGTALLMTGMSALGFGIASAAVAPPVMMGGKGKKVIVLGTGVAGLTSAYELTNAGYDVTVLEARDRVGGRSWTARKGTKLKELGGEEEVCDFDEGMYINPGPWRIPYFHRGYLHYAKKFGVPVELFNNDNDQSFINYEKGSGPLAGKPIRKVGVAADMRGYATEMLAKQVRQGALDAQFTPGDKELFLDYLKSEGYLTANDFKYIGAEGRYPEINPGAGIDPGEGKWSKPYPMSDLLQSGTWRSLRSIAALDQPRTMFQPVGGMRELPKGFGRWITSSDVSRLVQPYDLHYVSNSQRALVSDTRWFPVDKLASRLARAQIQPVPAHLEGAAVSAVPSGARLLGDAVSIQSGVAVVKAQADAAEGVTRDETLTPEQRESLEPAMKVRNHVASPLVVTDK